MHALRSSGNISFAARESGRARSAVYAERRANAAFAAEWDDALEEAADRLELEALRRAVDGTVEDRFFQGAVVGTAFTGATLPRRLALLSMAFNFGGHALPVLCGCAPPSSLATGLPPQMRRSTVAGRVRSGGGRVNLPR